MRLRSNSVVRRALSRIFGHSARDGSQKNSRAGPSYDGRATGSARGIFTSLPPNWRVTKDSSFLPRSMPIRKFWTKLLSMLDEARQTALGRDTR